MVKIIFLVLSVISFRESFANQKPLPDCWKQKGAKYSIQVNLENIEKGQLTGILYRAQGPNRPSYIKPTRYPYINNAGEMLIELSDTNPPDPYKLTRPQLKAAVESEISTIAETAPKSVTVTCVR